MLYIQSMICRHWQLLSWHLRSPVTLSKPMARHWKTPARLSTQTSSHEDFSLNTWLSNPGNSRVDQWLGKARARHLKEFCSLWHELDASHFVCSSSSFPMNEVFHHQPGSKVLLVGSWRHKIVGSIYAPLPMSTSSCLVSITMVKTVEVRCPWSIENHDQYIWAIYLHIFAKAIHLHQHLGIAPTWWTSVQ